MRIISYQQVRDYILCPRLFAYLHQDKIPVFHQTASMKAGQEFHLILDQHHKGIQLNPKFTAKEQVMWDHYRQFIQDYEDLLQWSETDFYLPLKINKEKLLIQGRFDRICLQEDNLILIDWKTGSEQALDNKQIEFYAWALWQTRDVYGPNIKRIQTHRVYLERAQIKKETYDRESLQPLHEEFVAILEKMNPEHYHFRPQPMAYSGHIWCHQCDFNKTCKKGQTHS